MSSVNVESLQGFLPHRKPMIWMDEVLETTATQGKCRLKIDASAPYWGPQGVLQCAPIEWMAQAAAFSAAVRWKGEHPGAPDKPLKEAFLVGIKDAWFADLGHLKAGMVVDVEVSVIKELPPLTLISASVSLEGALISKAVLKLFGQ